MPFIRIVFAASILGSIASCAHKEQTPEDDATQPGAVAPTVDFATQIKPILKEKCVTCHNREVLKEPRPSFESRHLAFRNMPSGPVIDPGNPTGSRLIQVIVSPEILDDAMPPVGHRVDAKELALLKTWITEGAEWPTGRAGRIVPDYIPTE